MKKTLWCRKCQAVTEQEHMDRRLCICTCGQENYLGARIPKPRPEKIPGKRGRKPVLSVLQIEEAYRLRYMSHMTWSSIAIRFGCCALTVTKAVAAWRKHAEQA